MEERNSILHQLDLLTAERKEIEKAALAEERRDIEGLVAAAVRRVKARIDCEDTAGWSCEHVTAGQCKFGLFSDVCPLRCDKCEDFKKAKNSFKLGVQPPVSVVGDPHVTNLAREQFEIRADGEHKLVQIPQLVDSSSAPDLRVDAVVQHLGAGSCEKSYMTSMTISGRWAEGVAGPLRIARGPDANVTLLVNEVEPAEFFQRFSFRGVDVGPLYLNFKLREVGFHVGKHFEGRYGNQQSYLNVRITGLKSYNEDVGGLLGYDSHEAAERPPANCTPAAESDGMSLVGKERSVPTTDGGWSWIAAE